METQEQLLTKIVAMVKKYNQNELDAKSSPQQRLIVEKHAGISSRHLIDCTARVRIGAFATIGGFGSQFVTHSIDLNAVRQSAEPIDVGEYCFVGTNCVLLGGSSLPHHSVLGAQSLLNKQWNESYRLYGGVPAKPIKELSDQMEYFRRTEGFVW